MSKTMPLEKFGQNLHLDPKRMTFVVERADVLTGLIRTSFTELCRLLAEIMDQQYYKKFNFQHGKEKGEPYTRFEDYVEDRIGWSARKGFDFINIHRKMLVEAKMTDEEMATIGWTKAVVLADLPAEEREPAKIRAWLTKAQTSTERDLRDEVEAVKSKALGKKYQKKEDFEWRNLSLAPDQVKNFDLAVKLAQELTGTKTTAFAIDMIALYFVAGHLEDSGEALRQILRNVERVFQVDMVAIKKGADQEIVHGEKIAKRLGVE